MIARVLLLLVAMPLNGCPFLVEALFPAHEPHEAPAPALPTTQPPAQAAQPAPPQSVCARLSHGREQASDAARVVVAETYEQDILPEKGFRGVRVVAAGRALFFNNMPRCDSRALHRVFDHPVYPTLANLCAGAGIDAVECSARDGARLRLELAQACVCSDALEHPGCAFCVY